jgi:hypothetical protein
VVVIKENNEREFRIFNAAPAPAQPVTKFKLDKSDGAGYFDVEDLP